eukprot:6056622-Ditylum_brightwellii.AAC.1
MQDTTRKNRSHCKVTIASLFTSVKHFFKPGGRMSITQGDAVGRIVDSRSDKYGQWVCIKFAARDKRVVMIIRAHQPCKGSKKHGTTTYHQEVAQLQQAS